MAPGPAGKRTLALAQWGAARCCARPAPGPLPGQAGCCRLLSTPPAKSPFPARHAPFFFSESGPAVLPSVPNHDPDEEAGNRETPPPRFRRRNGLGRKRPDRSPPPGYPGPWHCKRPAALATPRSPRWGPSEPGFNVIPPPSSPPAYTAVATAPAYNVRPAPLEPQGGSPSPGTLLA
jgi:hypothetical protein